MYFREISTFKCSAGFSEFDRLFALEFDECMNFLEEFIRMFLTSQMNNGMIE